MKSLIYSLLLNLLVLNIAIGQCFEPDASIWLDTWTSCEMTPNPKAEYGNTHWIQYDFGEVRQLSKTWVWNTNDPSKLNQGFNTVKVDLSVDGQEWAYWGEMNFPMAQGAAIYGGFPGPDLLNMEARYVLITVMSTHGDPSCAGIAEIKFNLMPEIQTEFPQVGIDCEDLEEFGIEPFIEEVTPTEAYIIWYDEEVEIEQEFQIRVEGEEDWITFMLYEPEVFLEFLEPGTTYEFRILIECDGIVYTSDIFDFTTEELDEDCGKVENIFLVDVTETTANIGWDGVGDEDFYIVRYGTDEDIYLDEYAEVEGETGIFLENLTPLTDYQLRVGIECEEYAVYSEIFNFRTEIISSTNELGTKRAFFKVYPNPTSGQFNLEYQSTQQDLLDYTITNVYGSVIRSNRQQLMQGLNVMNLDLGGLPDGVYMINAQTAGGETQISGRIVKVQ